MKASPIIVNWHAENAPIYSADFQPHGKGRLATAGGDNNVRLWKIESEGEDRKIEYLATLVRHNQAVNVVRWSPKGDTLASAGDDGTAITWVQDSKPVKPSFGDDGAEDSEAWRAKHMCRSNGSEVYDLAWSPDGIYFITGSMDNIARIYNAQTGQLVRQIAEHQHFVQGVAWDPLNEYIATQSSDRSVHIYALKTKDGQFTLDNRDEHPLKIGMNMRMDLPGRRISSNSPAPPDMGFRSQATASIDSGSVAAIGSPGPSCPGTPNSLALPMNPPSTISHSRRSSFGATSPSMSMRRSVSPAPSLPLPAVMPIEASPKPYTAMGSKNTHIYANDSLKSFFRRLTFTPEGSLLFTPAGLYSTQQRSLDENAKTLHEVINTVYIYTRGGINKPPIAHLPGHKKPSVVVKCSPILYTPRKAPPKTTHITIDTSSSEDNLGALPEAAITKHSDMDPPPLIPSTSDPSGPTSSPKPKALEVETTVASQGPAMAFSLPYRMVYAVATEDSVLLYDTQQFTPICVVSNLHCATFTDLTWANDGSTLLMTSSDGFCSTLTFAPGELGSIYSGEVPTAKHPSISAASSSSQNTPVPTPTSVAPPSPFPSHHRTTSQSRTAQSPGESALVTSARPSSPTRSNSTSSVATQSSFAPGSTVISNPPLVSGGSVPGIAATGSKTSINGGPSIVAGFVPISTPPQTPQSTSSSVSGVKREASESDVEGSTGEKKKRRIAPTLL